MPYVLFGSCAWDCTGCYPGKSGLLQLFRADRRYCDVKLLGSVLSLDPHTRAVLTSIHIDADHDVRRPLRDDAVVAGLSSSPFPYARPALMTGQGWRNGQRWGVYRKRPSAIERHHRI